MTSDFKPVIAVASPSSAERLGAAAVYGHFEAGGNLLYVGCSVEPRNRQFGHTSKPSPWLVRVTEPVRKLGILPRPKNGILATAGRGS
jgi:hypothetical protein